MLDITGFEVDVDNVTKFNRNGRKVSQGKRKGFASTLRPLRSLRLDWRIVL